MNYINMNTAGYFGSEHLSHKNGIESEGDSPGLRMLCAGSRQVIFFALSICHLLSMAHSVLQPASAATVDVFADMCKDLHSAYKTYVII
jgi:hypothetical protein